MTVVVPLSAFRSPCNRLSFGLLNLILASSRARATEGWTGGSQSDLTWKGWGSLSLLWNMYLWRILLVNWLRSLSSWRLIMFSFVTRVGMNFKPRDSKVICSSVSCKFDRFLICWLRYLMLFRKPFLSLIFLRSILLRLLSALLSVLFLFPSSLISKRVR